MKNKHPLVSVDIFYSGIIRFTWLLRRMYQFSPRKPGWEIRSERIESQKFQNGPFQHFILNLKLDSSLMHWLSVDVCYVTSMALGRGTQGWSLGSLHPSGRDYKSQLGKQHVQEAVERPMRGNGGGYLQEVTHQLGVFRGKKESERGSTGGGKGSDRHKLEADRCQFLLGLTGGVWDSVPTKAIDSEEAQAGEPTMLEGA